MLLQIYDYIAWINRKTDSVDINTPDRIQGEFYV